MLHGHLGPDFEQVRERVYLGRLLFGLHVLLVIIVVIIYHLGYC